MIPKNYKIRPITLKQVGKHDEAKMIIKTLLVAFGIWVAFSVAPVHAIQSDLAGLISELRAIRQELHSISGNCR